MPAERYFIADKLATDKKVILKDAEFHHLVHVMRVRKGDQVELINGNGVLASAVVEEIARDKALLQILSAEEHPVPTKRIILAQALPKQNRLDYILEKGTELGVDEFWLFPGDASTKKEFFPSHMERSQSILISALKQSGRLFLPEISLQGPIEEWQPFATTAFFGDVSPDAQLFMKTWQNVKLKMPVIFVTGPESGFTDREVELLKAKGAHGVKLHDNILRTDTASIAALSLIDHWLMSLIKV